MLNNKKDKKLTRRDVVFIYLFIVGILLSLSLLSYILSYVFGEGLYSM